MTQDKCCPKCRGEFIPKYNGWRCYNPDCQCHNQPNQCEHDWVNFTKEKEICLICGEKRLREEHTNQDWKEGFREKFDYRFYQRPTTIDVNPEEVEQFIQQTLDNQRREIRERIANNVWYCCKSCEDRLKDILEKL